MKRETDGVNWPAILFWVPYTIFAVWVSVVVGQCAIYVFEVLF